MADTRRDLSALQILLANNTSKSISAQDLRDFLVSTELKNIVTKVTSYTADADDQTILLDGTAAIVPVTLPTAVGILGKKNALKCIDKTNACTVVTNGAETIDGGANYTFANANDSILLASDNSNWQIIASDLAVVTAKIMDANVTHAKLATDAVEADNIKAGAVAASELATNAVETAKIMDENVTYAKLLLAATRQIQPVGSIIAWTDHIAGTPSMPDNWKLCDGTAISDADSPMNGETVPDLNGDGRFLRGGATSGTEQTDTFQGHKHSVTPQHCFPWVGTGGDNAGATGTQQKSTTIIVGNPTTDGANGTPRTANETRPINITVKWIIRIK